MPTSVRTIESVIDVPGWAPVTPYLNMAISVPTSQVNVLLLEDIEESIYDTHLSGGAEGDSVGSQDKSEHAVHHSRGMI